MADDFADFEAPSPATTTSLLAPISSVLPPGSTPVAGSFQIPSSYSIDSPWYAVWQRHTLKDFTIEIYVLLLLAFVIGVHTWGVRRNRAIAKHWLAKHRDVLEQEFAMVGFDPYGKPNTISEDGDELLASVRGRPELVLLKEKSPTEFVGYASGRKNVGFLHIRIDLIRRNNPLGLLGEYIASFIFDAIPEPRDSVTITISPFDGQEAQLRPGAKDQGGSGGSRFDNFIWAIVNKKTMSRWREERYDLSLTSTKDWEGLPRWTSVMSETREVGDLVLTREIKEAVVMVGEEGGLEYLIVSDQRVEKPTKIEETVPRKRLTMHITLPTTIVGVFTGLLPMINPHTPALLQAFIRLTDHLVNAAHFRPEVQRKLKATREEQIRLLKKVEEEEKAEERDQKRAEEKKRERDEKLRGMSAEEQKKFLDKEREKELRKMAKKQVRRG